MTKNPGSAGLPPGLLAIRVPFISPIKIKYAISLGLTAYFFPK